MTPEDMELLRCESSVTIIVGPPGFEPPPKNPSGPCPACGNGPTRGLAYCCWCDAVSPALYAMIRSAKIGVKSRDKHQAAEEKVKAQLDATMRKLKKCGQPILSERHRRRIWNGQIGGILKECPVGELTNEAKTGRDWLMSIGQPPDFSAPLKTRRVLNWREML